MVQPGERIEKNEEKKVTDPKTRLDPLRDPHAPACPRALLRPRACMRPRARMCPRACLRTTRVRLGRFKPINLVFGPVQAVSVGFLAGSKFLGVVLYYTKLIM